MNSCGSLTCLKMDINTNIKELCLIRAQLVSDDQESCRREHDSFRSLQARPLLRHTNQREYRGCCAEEWKAESKLPYYSYILITVQ
jgi:hypothetical protein